MPPPVVYKNWDILQYKIARKENQPVKKRVPNQTVVFEVDYVKYDPKIPRLTSSELELWLARQREPQVSEPETVIVPPPPPPPPDEPEVPVCEVQTEPFEPVLESIEEVSEIEQNGQSDQIESDSSQSDSIGEAVCEGELDKLVITEEYDEYRRLEDEDDADFFKSKKRIRPDPPVPPKPPKTIEPLAQHKTTQPTKNQNQQVLGNNSGLTQKSNEMTNGTTKNPSSSNHINSASTSIMSNGPRELPLPPKALQVPVEPDWVELAKKVDQNLVISVYKELSHFKDKVNSSQEGKKILKSAILKCIMEDETNPLIDLINLLSELNYEEDPELWKEVLPRINRKISSHGQVRKYKVKTNPDWVFANYQRAMECIFNHAKKHNKSLIAPNISLSVFISMIDPWNNYEILATNPDKKRTTYQEMLDKKIQIKKEIKRERQENRDPSVVGRKVEEIQKANGEQSFKITISHKGKPTKLAQRLRL